MKLIKQLLSDAWIDQQIHQLASERGDVEASLIKRLLGSIGANDWEAACGTEIRTRMRMCELQYVRGAPTDDVRRLCRETVESFLPKISKLDFSKRVVRVEGGMLRSHAKRRVETHGGKWWKDGQYYAGAEWSEMQQPLALDILRLWLMAAVAGSQELAAQLASAYEVPNADLLRSDEKWLIRRYVLRHALAREVNAEARLLELLLPGYSSGIPQDLIEFPIAVHRHDDELLRQALAKTCKAFKGKWDLKRISRWYDDHAHDRRVGSLDQVLEQTRKDLFNYHWVIAWWAIAWLNIAGWRGMTSIATDAKLFSEWVPRELCFRTSGS